MTTSVSWIIRLGVTLFYIVLSFSLWAAETPLLSVSVNTNDKAALQRGAGMFMNYCSGCHSLRYMRYNRMATDLGLITFDGAVDNDLLQSNLIFTSAKVQDPIQISMPEVDARQWFGRMPPDLSLIIRERGSAWIYTYLKSFYADRKRPFGANNLLVPDVSMPNVLAPLSGIYVAVPDHSKLVLMSEGTMTAQQFNQSLEDIVTFLAYVAEPEKAMRHHIGIFVLLYLFLLLIVVVLGYRMIHRSNNQNRHPTL